MKDRFGAKVKLASGETLLLDQEHVETVIPALNGRVLVLNGEHRGQYGTLQALLVERFSATIQLDLGQSVILPYEHFSKTA